MKKTEIKNIIKGYLLENKEENEIKKIFENKYLNIYNRIKEFNDLDSGNGFLRNSYNFLHKTHGRKCKNCKNDTVFINFFDGYKIFCENEDCKLERIKIKKEKISINNKKRKINYNSIENEKQYSFEEETNIIGSISKINQSIFERKYKSIFKNIKKYIELKNIENKNFNEEVFLYINQIIPNKCQICGGKDVKYNKKEKKYKEYCSIECYQKSNQFKIDRKEGMKKIDWKQRNQKYKETCINKYGVDNPLKNKEVSNKRNSTILNKKSYLLEITKNKIKITNILKYGFKNSLQNKLISEKVRQSLLNKTEKEKKEILNKKTKTSLKKYGVNHFMRLKENVEKIRKKISLNSFNKIKKEIDENFINDISFEEYFENGRKFEFNLTCKKCGNQFTDYFNYNGLPKCNKCNPINKSSGEKEITELFKNKNIQIIENDRKMIKPLELDIYLPEKKLAIEYNGLLFHSFGKTFGNNENNYLNKVLNNWEFENKNYHLIKTKLCEEKGIHLFHIFENEWKYDDIKKEIWKSMISSKLGKIDNKIFARKCNIKEVSNEDKNNFLIENHLQGKDLSKVRIGLYYNNELVQIMTFGKSRYNKNIDWEIHRFSTKKNTIIVGGASKIFEYFKNEYFKENETIITYADRRFSQGKIYETLGFNFSHNSSPNFFYFLPREKILHSRQQFQKHKLKDELKMYDENLTANENMFNNGYRRIWDCGNKVYVYKKNKIKII